MMMCFENIVTLPSGNTARGFNVCDLGNGRMQVAYVYTDRRRNHQVSRYFLAEFLNGRLQSLTARSARGGRVEFFSTSTIINELLEMLAEVSKANGALTNFRKDAKRVIETPVKDETNEQDDTDILDTASTASTLKTVGGMVMINILITLATLGIIGYNL